MIKVSLRGLAGRKLRAVLTGIAIVLGVAMISGTYILTDTINSAFNDALHGVVRRNRRGRHGQGPRHLGRRRGAAEPAGRRVAARDRARGRRCRARDGLVLDERNTKILTPEGEAVSSEGAPTFGFGIDTDPGARPVQPAEPLRGTLARRRRTRSSSTSARPTTRTTRSATPSRSRRCSRSARSSSSASRSTAASTASGTRASPSSRSRPRRSFSIARGSTTRSRSRRRKGVTEDELVAAIEPALPADAKVVSATAEAEEQVDEVDEFTAIFRYFLLAFAGIALFVGAFVIFNTFSITVAQRTREFATLRTIGASRRQILGSVILESLVIGLLASLVGLGLGVLLAEGIEALFGASASSFLPRIASSRCGRWSSRCRRRRHHARSPGLFPAIRATRVPPIAAVREGATLPHVAVRPFTPWIAALVVVARARPSRRARCSPTSSAPATACSRSPPVSCCSSSVSRCSRRTSSARSPPLSGCRRAARAASRASSPAAMQSAIPAVRQRLPQR